uniref:Uncharacterized protein n=1 Tax=Trichogramma kaykai TaxID=54128 RepID=A0ABD2XNW7_9HYME
MESRGGQVRAKEEPNNTWRDVQNILFHSVDLDCEVKNVETFAFLNSSSPLKAHVLKVHFGVHCKIVR